MKKNGDVTNGSEWFWKKYRWSWEIKRENVFREERI